MNIYDDRLVTIFEAKKELGVGMLKFLSLVNIRNIVALQSLSFGANIFIPYSEVTKVKNKWLIINQ
ncbi:MAG: hypothetical protein WAR79_05710 [Melioribacteraceae bacterium]